MKNLILLLAVTVSSSATANWGNGCGPCIDKTSCATGYLRMITNIGVDPSGSNLCKQDTKILSKADWLSGIKSGEIPLLEPALKRSPLKEIRSADEFVSLIEKNGGTVTSEGKENLSTFFSLKDKNPVMFQMMGKNKLYVFTGTSDGKTIAFSFDEFRGAN